jgi:hypothetical protein
LTADPAVAATSETHIDVPADQTMRTVTGITQTGTLRASIYARNTPGIFSAPSNVATKLFTGNVLVTQQVDLIVRSVPNVVSGFTAE